MLTHEELIELHMRVIACHCECLAFNAENMFSVINNTIPLYSQMHYQEVMQKWRLIDEKGEPTF